MLGLYSYPWEDADLQRLTGFSGASDVLLSRDGRSIPSIAPMVGYTPGLVVLISVHPGHPP